MVSVSKMQSQNMPAATVILVKRLESFTCMKKRITRLALVQAMIRATGAFQAPRSAIAAK